VLTAFRRRRMSRHQHDLVIGLGWHGQELLSNTDDTIMIAIDPAPDSLARDLCMRKGVPLIAGDAREEAVLHLAGIQSVQRAFIATGSDDMNIEIAHAIAAKVAGQEQEIVLAVSLQDKKSFQTLHGVLNSYSNIDLHTFNSCSLTAQALFSNTEYRIDRFEGATKDAHLVLIGDGTMARELLNHSLKYCIFEKEASLTIDVLWPNASEFAKSWGAEFPCYAPDEDGTYQPSVTVWLKERVLPQIRFHDLPPSERGQIDLCVSVVGNRQCVTTVIVAMRDPSNSCEIVDSIGATLTGLADAHQKDIEVWVYYNSRKKPLRDAMQASLKGRYGRLKPNVFCDYLGRFDRNSAAGKTTDVVAKRVNAMYKLEKIEHKSINTAQVEIDKEWREIIESDKDSSRQSAVHAFIKERIKGRLSGDEVSKRMQLAEIEHRRWCAEYLLKGYKPLTRNLPNEQLSDNENQRISQWFDKNQPEKKKSFKSQRLHVDLVPYHDLPKLLGKARGEIEQDKDHQIALLDWVLTGNPIHSAAIK